MGRRNKNIAKGENTVIGSGTIISGNIEADAMVMRIDGKVDGKVTTKGDLIIGQDGSVEGDVTAASLILAGSVNGNVNCEHKITIEAGGKLIGDINTELLAMDETAILQGRVNMVITQEKEDAVDNKKEKKVAKKKVSEITEENREEEAEDNE